MQLDLLIPRHVATDPERAGPVAGRAALTTCDDGSVLDPQSPEEWDTWVSASRTRNYLIDDPLLDWLNRSGEAQGFVRDDELDGFDPRSDFQAFIFERGRLFEDGVMRLVGERFEVTRIGSAPEDAQQLDRAAETIAAMERGAPIIAQAVLRNPQNRTYGVADLDRTSIGSEIPSQSRPQTPPPDRLEPPETRAAGYRT